ncbi:dihydrolipoamide acetyltransferase component of pyruvate dehydrogenase complex [Actinomycetospora sp. NBRC 106375]|uniref:dihydrolipoamide acetyltransferase family protein n=1 Tax=Actinomycetospora sp. NBRC 106375 TaxID=3032207 RepID=UPI0024A51552|nr:dihydrolipoamide acetyltransferase family protein [Actinomycetospora sp. NBRC 106375]GLZ49882.1 dihydrolipoamide acetyltransferase component of pyruvate dehydrogenase complex [Actinomycetospora sp. NBRC 106375]
MRDQIFLLPDLGEGLTEAQLIRWLVAVGDTVAVDEPVAEVETDKATVEVPSPFAGIVATRHGEEGTTLAVGEPLISISPDSGTDATPEADEGATYIEEERGGSGAVLIGYGTSHAAPSRRRRRRTAPANHVSVPTEGTSEQAAPQKPAVFSPLVRRLARDGDIDLQAVTGTGPGGLITRHDIARVATTSPADEPAAASPDADIDRRTALPVRTRIPITGMRRAIAETLGRSRAEIPEATTWVDVDATALLELRARLADSGRAPGLLAMVARFVVAGLVRFPELNARVDTERQEIAHLDGVNLGLATQTDRGLVVPAITSAHRLSMRGLDDESRRLIAAAREGTATAAELGSGSFTLNNYGVLGVDGSAAIINHPEVAILGMGRILPRPWVVDGQIVVRQVVQLSLVFDHRVCDGGTAGGFLRFVADAVENPTAATIEL